jgi:hypothetical protein
VGLQDSTAEPRPAGLRVAARHFGKLHQPKTAVSPTCAAPWGMGALLETVLHLPQLTDLLLTSASAQQGTAARLAGVTYTALTSSTNLCTLQLALSNRAAPQAYLGFNPATKYPNLHMVDLQSGCCSSAVPVSTLQLQHLIYSCPALESLEFVAWQPTALTALLPLLQLSALTCLGLHRVFAAAPTVLAFAAELSGLRQLNLDGLPQLRDPALLQLTALTALHELQLGARQGGTTAEAGASSSTQPSGASESAVCLRSKVSPASLVPKQPGLSLPGVGHADRQTGTPTQPVVGGSTAAGFTTALQ